MASSPSSARLFALIIGIDDYTQATGFDKLKGAVRDANSIRDWLIDDFNVPRSHIQDLRDEAATRKAIIQALEGLSIDSKIQRDDPILIYYAGHGTEAPAPKRWRWDAPKIQMIVPWDFKHPDGPNRIIQGIPDRTLGVLLTKLAEQKGDNITVIFDSCHSGSGTRSGSDTRVRGGPYEGEIPDNLDDDIVLPRTRGARVPDKFRHHGLQSHILLAACASHELAHENRNSGAFTAALLKALKGVDTAELTYEGLIERMDKLKTQSPQCEGYHRGRFLFDRKVANTKPVLDVTLKGDKLTIAGAGAIHGISVGSKFAIWKSRKDLHTEPLATVTVDVVKGNESVATFKMRAGSKSFVAQIKENPKPKLSIHVPKVIQNMDCFKNLISETEGRLPLSIVVVEDEALASIGLTYLEEYNEIGFKMLNPEEQGQQIRHTICDNAEDLHEALDHLCHYYYHRDRVNTKPQAIGGVPFSSKFTIDVFTLQENDEGIYIPSGPNLNIQGTGLELTVGEHNEDDMYGFKITNHTNLPVFPYLFYFDSSNFSISPIYQPVAVAQTGSEESSIPYLEGQNTPTKGRNILTVGYGSAGATPQNLAISDEELDLEQGYLRLYVSAQHVDLSTLERNAISTQTRGMSKANPKPPPIWDVITVPVVLRRGEDPPSSRMIGIIGSRNNGKSAFLEELFISLYGNTTLKPSFKNAFVSEYNITLPGSDKEVLTLVDLLTFEDNNIDNHASVLKATVAYLGRQYQSGRRFTSLIWCYNISKPRFTPIDGENLNFVKDICGPNALKNVVVLTTNWNKGAGAGTNIAKPRTVAGAAAPLQRFETVESQLQSLCEGVMKFERFGTFSDPASREMMLGTASAGKPLELIQSLLSQEEVVLQVQREACETKKLAGTTAGKRLQSRLEKEILRKGEDIRSLDEELEELDSNDTEREAIQVERDDAEQDMIRWKGTLEQIEVVNSAFI